MKKINVNKNKKSFRVLRTMPSKTLNQLRIMNNSEIQIAAWQKRNITRIILFSLAGLVLGTLSIALVPSGLIVGLIYYFMQLNLVQNVYHQYRFERQIEFVKIILLISPLLYRVKNGSSLYQVFDSVLPRISNDIDRNLLMKLMLDVNEFPGEIHPFLGFADQMSGTNISHLIMSTLYDIEIGSVNLEVVDRLGELISEEMMKGMDFIIEIKMKKFNLLFTKLLGSIVVLLVGFFASLLIYQLGSVGFRI